MRPGQPRDPPNSLRSKPRTEYSLRRADGLNLFLVPSQHPVVSDYCNNSVHEIFQELFEKTTGKAMPSLRSYTWILCLSIPIITITLYHFQFRGLYLAILVKYNMNISTNMFYIYVNYLSVVHMTCRAFVWFSVCRALRVSGESLLQDIEVGT